MWNGEFCFLFPLNIGFLSLFLFWHFILWVFLPNKVLFCLIPNSLFLLFLDVLILYHILHFIRFDFREGIKLSLHMGIFSCRNVLRRVLEISFHRFFLFIIKLNLNTINQINWNSLIVQTLSVLFKLFDLVFSQYLFPFARATWF